MFKEIMIEPTNICNLDCPNCKSAISNKKEVRGNMSFDNFKRIIDSLKNRISVVNLYNFGEPLASPDIVKMMRYINSSGMFFLFHTNGMLLTKDMVNEFISFKKNKPFKIVFSIDGISQETYSQFRRQGDYIKVIKNLKYLIKIRNEYDLKIKIIWQFLVTGANEHEVEDARIYIKNLGVDILRFKTISIGKGNRHYDKLVPKDVKYQREEVKNVDVKLLNYCDFVDPGRPVISYDGRVWPCCLDLDDKYSFGNVFEEDMVSIWNSSKYKKFRKDFCANKNKLCNDVCRNRGKFKRYSEIINFERASI